MSDEAPQQTMQFDKFIQVIEGMTQQGAQRVAQAARNYDQTVQNVINERTSRVSQNRPGPQATSYIIEAMNMSQDAVQRTAEALIRTYGVYRMAYMLEKQALEALEGAFARAVDPSDPVEKKEPWTVTQYQLRLAILAYVLEGALAQDQHEILLKGFVDAAL